MSYPTSRTRAAASVLCLLAATLLAGCARRPPPPAPDAARPPVQAEEEPGGAVSAVVSIPPQAYFVERVGGDRVTVEVLVGPGDDPHVFEPTARRMAVMTEADVYFRIGVPFEDGLVARLKSSAPGLRIVDTRAGITLRPMAPCDAHSRGRQHHGHDDNMDPHTWLDPLLVAKQAETMRGELARIDPAGADVYTRNLAAFAGDLERLHRELEEALRPMRGDRILVFHPAFGYFADRYGLTQVAVETEGKEPSPRQLADLVALAREAGIRVVFVQPQFSTKSAEAIAREIGGTVVPLDPLARDYLANLRAIADAIRGLSEDGVGR